MKPKSKKSDQILFWLSILAIVLIGSFLIFVSEVEKSEKEIIITTTTTITTTTILVTTTTEITTTTLSKTTSTTVATTTSTSTSTTTTVRKKIKTCDDYCTNKGYKSGICRINPSGCIIKGVNEVYSPMGNRYCPRGEIEDSCCCVVK